MEDYQAFGAGVVRRPRNGGRRHAVPRAGHRRAGHLPEPHRGSSRALLRRRRRQSRSTPGAGSLLEALRTEWPDLDLRLYWGNRNWHPLLEDTVAQMRDDGIERALAFVTSAYGGYSSCRQYLDDIAAAGRRVGEGAPAVDKLRLYYNHPGWVSRGRRTCWQRAARAHLGDRPADGDPVEVIFTAHSIPAAWLRPALTWNT